MFDELENMQNLIFQRLEIFHFIFYQWRWMNSIQKNKLYSSVEVDEDRVKLAHSHSDPIFHHIIFWDEWILLNPNSLPRLFIEKRKSYSEFFNLLFYDYYYLYKGLLSILRKSKISSFFTWGKLWRSRYYQFPRYNYGTRKKIRNANRSTDFCRRWVSRWIWFYCKTPWRRQAPWKNRTLIL